MTTTLSEPLPRDVMMPMSGIVQARGLTKSFRMGESDFRVLRQLDFDLKPGEFVAIEGRSGSGKSTLLHIMAALDSADAGSVSFEGSDYTRRTASSRPAWLKFLCWQPSGERAARISVATPIVLFVLGLIALLLSQGIVPAALQRPLMLASFGVLGLVALLWLLRFLAFVWFILARLDGEGPAARLRNRQFGFIFQFYHLLPELNVLENTMLAPSIQFSWLKFGAHRATLRGRAIELLDQLGMSHRLTHRPSQLSGGERQRVAIARALMNRPKVLFADEPTGNLDAETGRQIMDVLEKLHREQGQTIVMVTHDRTLAREADRVLVLKDGRLAEVERDQRRNESLMNSNDDCPVTKDSRPH
jgi:ABC-type lipoprotein export system ATPase subunit